jgi:glycosyltransferase Alg8
MEEIKVYEALNKGKGGNGYIRFSKTFDSVLKNCYVEGIRHLVFQWGASRNLVEDCYLKVDINFHGGFDRNNTVKNCIVEINKKHPWKPIEKTPLNAKWAPPDGEGNKVLDCKFILN